jgi:hypothetical protein
VDNLNQRLGEVDEKCQNLSSDMATQSKVLSDTAKRWVDEISALDRGLAGTLFLLGCIFYFLLPASSWRLAVGLCQQPAAGLLRISPASSCR